MLTEPLDYEQRSRYTLTVRASDSQHEAEANVTVLVEDVNDNAPTFGQTLYQVPAFLPLQVQASLVQGGSGEAVAHCPSSRGHFWSGPPPIQRGE